MVSSILTIVNDVKTFVTNNSDAFRFALLSALAWTLFAIHLVFDEIEYKHTLSSMFIFNFICGFFGAIFLLILFYF